MKFNLSKNEAAVLKHLIKDGRISRTSIASDIGITSQAVGKIQDRLEKSGVIKGYSTIIDYEKLGIECFAIAFFRFKSGSWTNYEESDIESRIKGPHLINVYRIPVGDLTHMVLYGFRNLKELDHYFHHLQTEREHISELKRIYVISPGSIMKDSPNELFIKLINEYDSDVLATPEIPQPNIRLSEITEQIN